MRIPPHWLRYVLPLLASALAALLAESFQEAFAPVPLLPFLLAVIVSARFGGTGPGLLATALGGAACIYLHLSPFHAVRVATPGPMLRLSLFLAVGVAVSFLVGQLRAARRVARAGAADARDLQERYRVTLLSIGDAVVAADANGRVSFLNPVAEEATGWPEQEAIGRPLTEVFAISSETTRQPVDDPAARVLAQGGALRLTTRAVLRARDGVYRPIDHTAAPVRDAKGRITGTVIVFRDATERRRDEGALRLLAEAGDALAASLDAEATLAAAARVAVPRLADWCAVYLVDDSGGIRPVTVVHADPPKEEMLRALDRRYPLDAGAAGGVPGVLRSGRPELVSLVTEDMVSAGARDAEHLALLRTLGPRSVMIVPLGARGRTLGAMTFTAAESSRRYGSADLELALELARRAGLALDHARLYREAKDAVRLREEADRHKDDFLAMLAHELRNPLAPLRNALHILNQTGVPGEVARESRAMIGRQVRHLARLVDDLLDVSRVSRGKVLLRPKPLDLVEVVRAAAEDRRSHVEEGGITLELELPDEPLWVEADPTRVAQVLDNLLGNAVKFTDPGGRVTVHVATIETDRLRVTVEDTGVGIAAEMLPKLWDPFAQADTSLERSQGGLGLGLALVKGLIELHGGQVEAASNGPGKGAAFSFVLPRRAAPLGGTRSPEKTVALPKSLRVLIVEDNRDAAESLRMLLELSGVQAEVAYTGPEGVEAARRSRPHVILCDLGLPGLSGFEVARAIRHDPATASAYLAAVSGYGQPEDREKSRRAGFDVHFVKPVEIDELRRLLVERKGC